VTWSGLVGRDYEIRARRVLATGVAEPEVQLRTGTLQDVVWDGSAYDLAFSSVRPSPYDIGGDLALLRLRSSGQPIETLSISATPDDDRSASLVPIGNGRVLAAYTRVAFESPYDGVERAFVNVPRPARGRATSKGIR